MKENFGKVIDVEVISEEVIDETPGTSNLVSNKVGLGKIIEYIIDSVALSWKVRIFAVVPLLLLIASVVISIVELFYGYPFQVKSLFILPGFYLALLVVIFIKNRAGAEILTAVSMFPGGWLFVYALICAYYGLGSVLFAVPIDLLIPNQFLTMWILFGAGFILFLFFEKYFMDLVNGNR